MLTSPKNLVVLKNEELRHVLRCLAALSLVIVVGTVGFCLVEEDWGLWKSLFFTLITITTVGYGDQGLSDNGQVFAAVLLLFGIGTATYSVTALVQVAVSYQNSGKRRMKAKVARLENHFVICGYGRIGQTVCGQLAEAELPFVVVDSCPTEIENATDHGYLALLGNSTDDELLLAAGIERARGVICAINSDAENIFVILCARELNKDVFVATRASTDAAARRMERAGASLVVSPYTTAGQNIADAIVRPRLAEFLRTHRADEYELSALTIKPGSSCEGRSIREVGEEFPTIVFVAVERAGMPTTIRPGGNQILQVDDRITLAGAADDLEQLFALENASLLMA